MRSSEDIGQDASALRPDQPGLEEVAHRYRRDFADVAGDPVRARLVWAGVEAALDLGYRPAEAVSMAARAVRQLPDPYPADSPQSRSLAIEELARARGQR